MKVTIEFRSSRPFRNNKLIYHFPPLWVGKMLRGMRRVLPGPAYDQVARPLDALAPKNPHVVDLDRINFPRPLTQPDVDPEQTIADALKIFAKRHPEAVPIAVSLPGKSALCRFIKLPPVESRKISDIVKYEARQQIPFRLDDVEWDYFQLLGCEDEGYSLDTELAIVAEKSDIVARALDPFELADIANRVDLFNADPVLIADMLWHDFGGLDQEFDPKKPHSQPYTLALNVRGDTTDLVIANGQLVWQRTIPIGTSNFVKAISKEFRLTNAKAREYIRENSSDDLQRAVTPVVKDLLTELHRSIGFFTSNNRDAQFGEILFLGDIDYVPGLKQHIIQGVQDDSSEYVLDDGGESLLTLMDEIPLEGPQPAVKLQEFSPAKASRSRLLSESHSPEDAPFRGLELPEANSETLRLLATRVDERGVGSVEAYAVPLMAALQRLSYGKYRINLYPKPFEIREFIHDKVPYGHKFVSSHKKSYAFAPKAEEAWGIEVADDGIKCVRVALM